MAILLVDAAHSICLVNCTNFHKYGIGISQHSHCPWREKFVWTDFKASAKYFSKFLGAAILLGLPVFVVIIILMAILWAQPF